MTKLGLVMNPKDCQVPVRYEAVKLDGSMHRESQTINRVNWPVALNGLRAHGITHIIVGPGAGVAQFRRLKSEDMASASSQLLPKGVSTLLSAQRIHTTAPIAWATYAPALVTRGDGTTALENALLSGQVILQFLCLV